jgi:hypothetical protein
LIGKKLLILERLLRAIQLGEEHSWAQKREHRCRGRVTGAGSLQVLKTWRLGSVLDREIGRGRRPSLGARENATVSLVVLPMDRQSPPRPRIRRHAPAIARYAWRNRVRGRAWSEGPLPALRCPSLGSPAVPWAGTMLMATMVPALKARESRSWHFRGPNGFGRSTKINMHGRPQCSGGPERFSR